MKIICSQESLIKALNIVSKAISNTSTLEITKGILIKTEGDTSISLSATDIQMAITTKMNAITNEHGAIVVNGRKFREHISKLPKGQIVITVNEKKEISINTSSTDYKLQGIEEKEFPRIETDEEVEEIKIPKTVLREMIEGTCFAASIDESRGIIVGTLLEVNSDEITMVALDGYRVGIRREENTNANNKDTKIVIPAKMLREVGKILSDSSIDEEEEIKIDIAEAKVKVFTDDTCIRMNLLEGEFIKYKDIIPKEHKTSIHVDRTGLLASVERASLLRSDGKNAFVRFSINDDELIISSRAEEGQGKETIKIIKDGENLEIGFDAKFVIEGLKAIGEEEIVMFFNTSVSPCLIRPLEGNNFEYMILPVRLSTIPV